MANGAIFSAEDGAQWGDTKKTIHSYRRAASARQYLSIASPRQHSGDSKTFSGIARHLAAACSNSFYNTTRRGSWGSIDVRWLLCASR